MSLCLGIWDCQQHNLPAIWTPGIRKTHIHKKDIFLKTGPSENLLKLLQGAFKWILAQSSINVVLPMKSTNSFNAFVCMDSIPRFTSNSCLEILPRPFPSAYRLSRLSFLISVFPHLPQGRRNTLWVPHRDVPSSGLHPFRWVPPCSVCSHPCKVMLLWDSAISPSISPRNATFTCTTWRPVWFLC